MEVPSRSDVLELLTRSTADDFTTHHLLDRVPWLFNSRFDYVIWRGNLAFDLEVDPFNVLVVGSACIGRSLSPEKSLAAFSNRSDIDVAVVSARHFDAAWRWLRNLGPVDALGPGTLEREMLRWHRRNLVFDGTIATDKLLGLLPFGPAWGAALGRASASAPISGLTVKARIYRDFEALRSYSVRSVGTVKKSLLTDYAPHEPLPLRSVGGDEDLVPG